MTKVTGSQGLKENKGHRDRRVSDTKGTNLPRARIGLLSCRDLDTFSLFVRLSSSAGRGLLVIKWVTSLQKKSSRF